MLSNVILDSGGTCSACQSLNGRTLNCAVCTAFGVICKEIDSSFTLALSRHNGGPDGEL